MTPIHMLLISVRLENVWLHRHFNPEPERHKRKMYATPQYCKQRKMGALAICVFFRCTAAKIKT
jgi:hypothetical protein